jgi:pyridoxamine 5'-phosphate oxidase
MKSVKQTILSLRDDFNSGHLDEKDVSKSPIVQFEKWMKDAIKSGMSDPHAMTLATAGNGEADARVVLLRNYDGRGFTFFTNYFSIKGKEIRQNKRACLNFFWPDLQRQIRIKGVVEKVSSRVSDAYFRSRPKESQIGAWASCQSEKLKNRNELVERFKKYEKEFAVKAVPRPPHWGGYRLRPSYFEFWQGRPNRLHDRIIYEKNKSGKWQISRLNP